MPRQFFFCFFQFFFFSKNAIDWYALSSILSLLIHPQPADLTALAKKGDLAGLEKGVAALGKAIASIDKKDNAPVLAALATLSALATTSMLQCQPYLLPCLEPILDATGDKVPSSASLSLLSHPC